MSENERAFVAHVTEDDIRAGLLVGAKGHEVYEAAIHSQLDRAGVPRRGREVSVTLETITIGLPRGWTMEDVIDALEDEES